MADNIEAGFATGRALPSVTSENALLQLKLFKEMEEKANGDDPTSKLIANELSYMKSAISLLNKDKVLQVQLGGNTFSQAIQLSELLKQQTQKVELENRLKKTVDKLLAKNSVTKEINDKFAIEEPEE